MKLDHLVMESVEVLESEFGIKPVKSIYTIYAGSPWKDFLHRTSSDPVSEGVYLPRTMSAHLKQDSFFLPVNLLHEYFGHGLYCEYALRGQRIVTLEQALAETERKMLGLSKLPEEKHFRVDVTNPLFEQYKLQREELQEFFSHSVDKYEGFAMWVEHLLSQATNQEPLFQKKMEELVHPDYKSLFEHFLGFSEQNGNFALIAQLGFPKYYNASTVVETLRKLYKDDFDSIRIAILYGSRKPYSDIDLFIVSDKIKPCYNSWLDIYAVSHEEFEDGLANLSIAVTDPLFTGKVIVGNHEYIKRLQKRVLNRTITHQAVTFNLQQSEEQGKIALMYPEGSKERKICLSYQQSFRRNAEELRKGNKMLTLR
jgi:stress-induced morphogen